MRTLAFQVRGNMAYIWRIGECRPILPAVGVTWDSILPEKKKAPRSEKNQGLLPLAANGALFSGTPEVPRGQGITPHLLDALFPGQGRHQGVISRPTLSLREEGRR